MKTFPPFLKALVCASPLLLISASNSSRLKFENIFGSYIMTSGSMAAVSASSGFSHSLSLLP